MVRDIVKPTDYGMNSLTVGVIKEVSKLTGCTLEEAFHRLYGSEFFRLMTNIELGLFYRGQSNLAYVFVNDLIDEL
jgi:hypothetical protein